MTIPARPSFFGEETAREFLCFMDQKKILVFGIGNPGRGDDGLGPKFVERLRGRASTDAEFKNSAPAGACDLEFRYQLNIEDALTIKDHDFVVFADATTTGEEPATVTEIFPSDAIAFTTHRMSPAAVLALCHELFGRAPRAYTLAIRGYDWDIGESLSEQAESNLELAIERFHELVEGLR